MSGIIDPNTRVSLIGGAFNGRFQIPNSPGEIPALGLNVLGATRINSSLLNDAIYEIRNGTGVGVGAPQFGIRRAILAGLAQRF